jgi:hypothetical protein
MGIIALAVVVDAILLIVGLVKRKRVLILLGAPAAAILVWWFVTASRAPDLETEFARDFGSENRSVVSDIQTIKPTLMDGHFISFHISQSDFESRILSRFGPHPATSGALLQGQSLPKGWPLWIEHIVSVNAEVDHQRIFVVYGPKEQRAFASVEYEQW